MSAAEKMTDRVIALVDMDCFYCQVEERLNPQLKGKPTVVVQYNPWKGGGIIAVNYEARAQGVKRGMRGDQAKNLCPDVVLCSVPMIREKADLTRYRNAGREVIDVMCKFSECVQRASIDEAYLDLTEVVKKRLPEFQSSLHPDKIGNTFVVGYSNDSSNEEAERREGTGSWLKDLYYAGLDDVDTKKLAVGAVIVEEMRNSILEVTGFKCSAGIAHNKILAKLAAGIHKPNRQTVLPHASVAKLYASLPVHKIRNLGGKLGRELEDVHGVKMMADLLRFSQAELVKLCDERMGSWLYQIARGFDDEPVQARLISKSIACCKNFPGRMSLSKGKEVEHWLNKLTEELLERLLDDELMNQRRAQHMVFSIRVQEVPGRRGEVASSKSVPLSGYHHEKIVNSARTCLKKFCSQDPNTKVWSPTITFLGLSAGKFIDTSNKLKQLFNNMQNNRTARVRKSNETSGGAELANVPRVMGEFVDGSEDGTEQSKYFRSVNEDAETDVDNIPAGSHKRKNPSDDGLPSNEAMNHSSIEESAGPSFFERMLLDDVPNNGKRIKLNVLPVVPQPSPGKPSDDKPPDISASAVAETKAKSCKMNNFFKKSPSGLAIRDNSEAGKMSKPTKEVTTSFFTKTAPNWVDPAEIFPDVEAIDDATLAVFPPAYQKRILELKKAKAEEQKRVELSGLSAMDDLEKAAGSENDRRVHHPTDSPRNQCESRNLHSEINSDTCEEVEYVPCAMKATNFPVPKQSENYKIHDSQQPSTSGCGLEVEAMEVSDSSPDDMFAEQSLNGPVRRGSSSNDSFGRQGSPKSPKTDGSISNELGKYTIHDQSSTSKGRLGGGSSPEDIFAQDSWQPPSDSAQRPTSEQASPKVTCPDCRVLLRLDEVDEHADFHFALKLQDEMNQPVAARPAPTPSLPNKPAKRNVQSKSSKNPDVKKMKSIDSFFKKAS